MIVLDTNVLSEPMRPAPDRAVVDWLDEQHVGTLYITTVTLAEIRYGIAALPSGRRRQWLNDSFESRTIPLFAGRILAFDEPASAAYADLQAHARARGAAMNPMDGMIAAICRASDHALATRNVSDFTAAGLTVINPWQR